MTKSETAKIITSMQAYYPNFYKDYNKEKTITTIDAWYEIFKDYDYLLISASLKTYITSDTKGFPPVPGQLIDNIHKFKSAATEELNELTAWEMVHRALKNSNYGSEEEYAKLPDAIKRCIKDPAVLREWAALDNDEVNTVISSNFMRTFRGETEREKQRAKIPADVLRIIDNTKMLIGGGGK